ncbi:MAG TPA: serine hydroxymethyltransferase [Nitrososphaerales archaeon]|nr:serine hydroxymethyltransferase [Nitrososphaerales archaeon]
MSFKSPRSAYDQIFQSLETHQDWFANSIPLIASENVPSPAVREAILSDFGNRYAEGWAGERVYAGCTYIDQVELLCMELARKLFDAEFADVRPVSGVCANLTVYSAFTDPGDTIMALAIPNGGHISSGRKEFNGTAGLVHGLEVEYFAFDRDNWNIDVDKTKEKIKKLEAEGKKPKMTMFGGSLFLFPHPVRELADFLKGENIFVCYDSAHVSGLIAGGQFQQPLKEGADAVTLSTHKTLFGPQGGTVLSWNKFADKIKAGAFPGTSSNHHLHHVAGKAVAFAEFLEFGRDYASQVISNAQSLAGALSDEGVDVLASNLGFTKSHQIAMDITKYGDGGTLEKELERANIIANRQLIPGDIKAGRHYMHPGGLRIGTSEVTRLGMKQGEMKEIARLMSRVIVKKEDPSKVRQDVQILRRNYQKVHYAFETTTPAYKYVQVR